jgi:hypothetical protein
METRHTLIATFELIAIQLRCRKTTTLVSTAFVFQRLWIHTMCLHEADFCFSAFCHARAPDQDDAVGLAHQLMQRVNVLAPEAEPIKIELGP